MILETPVLVEGLSTIEVVMVAEVALEVEEEDAGEETVEEEMVEEETVEEEDEDAVAVMVAEEVELPC